VAPGSIWATKRYPYYSNVIDLVHEQFLIPVILMGGPGDMSLTRSIRDTSVMRLVDLAGQTDLLESAAIISKAKLVISNDSAPAHIAAAVGTPVVAIFGPTSPSFGFAPYSDRATVVEVGNIYCRPCTRHGSKRCPERHFECMKKLVPDQIIRAARSLLGG
jgi:heptosyltransferase-2